MSLTLTVDGERWRTHLQRVATERPGLVPVGKGNGYGLGLGRLARKAQWLADRGHGVDVLAVGTYDELPEVAGRFGGSLLVLTPWRPFRAALDPAVAGRVIHTVSRPADLLGLLEAQPDARFVLERLTSMLRHGMSARELRETGAVVRSRGGRGFEGVAVHLPLTTGAHLPEMHRLMNDVVAAELPRNTLWVSHLDTEETRKLGVAYPDVTFRPRIGTELWLGDRASLRVTARVLDVHPVARGEVFGYRGRSVPRAGHLVVVSGGTAHGIGLSAPTGDRSVRSRASALARGGLDALGLARSPYVIAGKPRLFAEPPHMQASMLFLPDDVAAPEIGDEIEVRVRFTTTDVDRVVLD